MDPTVAQPVPLVRCRLNPPRPRKRACSPPSRHLHASAHPRLFCAGGGAANNRSAYDGLCVTSRLLERFEIADASGGTSKLPLETPSSALMWLHDGLNKSCGPSIDSVINMGPAPPSFASLPELQFLPLRLLRNISSHGSWYPCRPRGLNSPSPSGNLQSCCAPPRTASVVDGGGARPVVDVALGPGREVGDEQDGSPHPQMSGALSSRPTCPSTSRQWLDDPWPHQDTCRGRGRDGIQFKTLLSSYYGLVKKQKETE